MSIALKQYVDQTTEILARMHPEWDSERIEKIVVAIVQERCQDPVMRRENNVRGEYGTTTLLATVDWLEETKPVVAGNGTFYCQPEVERSPTSMFLKTLKNRRAEVKRELFKQEPGTMTYILLDLESGNIKVIMNANYGAAANASAAFHDDYSPAAITLMAQSIITTAAAFFEGFCGDNQRFFHLNECFDWIRKVISKTEAVHKWVYVPTTDEVVERIISKFEMIGPQEIGCLRRYLSTMGDTERVYLYYANNLRGFMFRHSPVKRLIPSILSTLPVMKAGEIPEGVEIDSVGEWNKQVSKAMFLDPYGVPDCIKDDLERLQRYLVQYVFVEYLTPDSVAKLNNHERNTVLLVDTDSNGIYLGQLVEFVMEKIVGNESYGREKMYNEIIIVAIITSTLSKCIALILDYYGRCHNLGEEARKELSMKNEFLWTCFFVMFLKKHYAALVAMREGNISIPFRLDIKGMDFIKAGVGEEVSKKFTKLLTDYILYPDEPNLRGLMVEIRKFENEIYYDLSLGGTNYLKSQQYKPYQAYSVKEVNGVKVSSAWTQQVFRGSEVWNLLEDDHRIAALDRVKIVKTTIEKIDDVYPMRDTHPEMFGRIVDRIYGNENPKIAKTGLSVICIPPSVKKIPDWLLPYVNKDLVVSDTMSSFSSVLETFGITQVSFKTPNSGEVKKMTGLISL